MKIEDVKIVKAECEGFLKMGKSRFRVTFTIDLSKLPWNGLPLPLKDDENKE